MIILNFKSYTFGDILGFNMRFIEKKSSTFFYTKFMYKL